MLPGSGIVKLLGFQWSSIALHVENNCHLVRFVDCDDVTQHNHV